MDVTKTADILAAEENRALKKMRKVFRELDEKMNGLVKYQIFWRMLDCMSIDLDLVYRRKMMQKFEKNGWLKYNESLETLYFCPKEKKWKSKLIEKPLQTAIEKLS